MTERRRGFVVGFRCWRAQEWSYGTVLLPVSGRYKRHWRIDGPTKAICTRAHLPAESDVDVAVAWAPDLVSACITATCGDVVRSVVADIRNRVYGGRAEVVSVMRSQLVVEVQREYAKKHRAQVPSRNCTCGLHAYVDAASALRYEGNSDYVIGAVLGWDRVVPYYGEGWRARLARPIALVSNAKSRPAAHTYGIPLIAREALEPYALEFGERLPKVPR
jgi:hypothetical protein